MKKKTSLLVVCTLAVSLLAGCNNGANTTSEITVTESTAEIANQSEELAENDSSEAATQDENEITTQEMLSGKYLKLGSGISSLSKKESDYIIETIDKYHGKGVLTDVDMTSKTVQFYNAEIDESGEFEHHDCTLYFIDEAQSVPYMTMDDLVAIQNEIIENDAMYNEDAKMTITGTAEDGEYSMTRENGSSVHFDFDNNLIVLIGYGKFVTADNVASVTDPVQYGSTADDSMLKHTSLYAIEGEDLVIDLNAYGIHLINKDGEFYCPVSTYSDLFTIKTGGYLGYNTENLFNAGSVSTSPEDEFGQLFYGADIPEKRSKDLINYTYCELCLALDFQYGLKEEHGITSFDEYFASTGLYKYLLSEDSEQYVLGLFRLTCANLADGHTDVVEPSLFAPDSTYNSYFLRYYNGGALSEDEKLIGKYYYKTGLRHLEARNYRQELYGDDVPMGYSEIGDTAFITFDLFDLSPYIDYMTCELENDPNDTMMLVLYSHARITREGSPIKNVVLNVANNGGGASDAAAIIISWFAGSDATFSISNTTTGDIGVTAYSLDANRDGVHDSKDVLSRLGYKLYCVTSETSFSSGNLTPAALKSTGKVLMLGRKSGGGACGVQYLVTPDGLTLKHSGQLRINVVKNGTLYSVDEGVEPDVIIADEKNIYSNEYIAELIHRLD